MKRLTDFIERHQKGFLLLVLVCVMTIGTSIYLIIPRAKSAANYNQLIESLGGEEAVRSSWDEAEKSDIFTHQSGSNTSYKDTEEYQNKESEIDFKTNRYNDIKNNSLVTNLDVLISNFFTSYTAYLQNASPANTQDLTNYASSECKSKIQNDKSNNKGPYLVNYTRFADLNKQTILAYVEMRNESEKFFVSCIKNTNGKWVVNDFVKIA